MTIHSKESPFHQEEETSKTESTADSSLINIEIDEKRLRKLLKGAWRAILMGDLERLRKIQDKLIVKGQQLSSLRLNKFGWTPLHAACYFGRLDIVKFLVEEGHADPNDQNSNGWHSLIFAVMGGQGP